MSQSKRTRKQTAINGRLILALLLGLGLISIIFLVMIATSAETNGSRSTLPDKTEQGVEQEKLETTKLAIVKEIDAANKKIQLYDVDSRDMILLSYSGGTNITDKYGGIISMSQVQVGSMVDIIYSEAKGKLTDMNISTKAWEYAKVSNMGIDLTSKVIKIADQKYKYEDDLIILDNGEFISVSDLAEQDELTVRGYEETIWSITVTRGHGTVVLQEYDAFLGDYITIGYEAMQQITDNMEITVREGNFNLTVENAAFSATKNITVNRNLITYVSLKDLGPGASAVGMVTFQITPFGADLYIDDELTSYADSVELIYGSYDIKVSMGGYTSYEGTLVVDSSGKSISIDLPESSAEEEATIVETDTQSGTDTTTASETTDNTDANASEETSSGTSEETEQAAEADYSEIDPDDIDENHLIYVQEPVGTSVYIDGSFMCIAPGSFKKITGTHVITFIKEGYETMSYTIEVSDDNLDTYFTFPNLAAESN